MEHFEDIELVENTQIQKETSGDRKIYTGEAAYLVRDLLAAIGEDPNREGLIKTPERVARMLPEILSGYQVDLARLVNGAVFDSNYQGVVKVQDIEFYSICEHHLLPFFGKAQIAYIPNGKIIGLSKIPRIVDMYARRLQLQEQMTQQIAEAIDTILQPKGVAVRVEGAHMCAMMRGVKKSEARMVTSTLLGQFKNDDFVLNS